MDQLKDIGYSIKETFFEVWDGLQDRFPFLSTIPQHKLTVLSGAAILISLICVVKTLGNTQTASEMQQQAASYKAGQAQIDASLGDPVTVAMDDEFKDINGITNQMLQYKDLTSMPSDSGITSMKKSLGIGGSAIEDENEDYIEEMSSQIKDFAGNYGGALVIPTTYGTNSLKLAAYDATASMRTPGSGISNVLYEKIGRTIESTEYGVSDKSDTVIFLSAANVSGISSVREGSVLYTLFGEEDREGSKEMNKYICTCVAEGEYVTDDSEKEEEGLTAKTSSKSRDTDDEESDYGYGTSEVDTEDYGDEEYVFESDDEDSVPVVETDATKAVITSEDVVEGEASYNSDGTISEEWAEDNEDAETVTSDISEDKDAEDVEEDDEEFSASGDGLPTSSKYSVKAAQVLDEDGNVITENKTADLILYQYSRRTGKVKITYWNLESSDAAKSILEKQTASNLTTEETDTAETTTQEEN